MYTFFSVVFGIIWALASFVLLFKVWGKVGPMVLNISKSHIVQLLCMLIIWLVIFMIPTRIWIGLFG